MRNDVYTWLHLERQPLPPAPLPWGEGRFYPVSEFQEIFYVSLDVFVLEVAEFLHFQPDHYPHLFPELLTRVDAGTEAGDEQAQCL